MPVNLRELTTLSPTDPPPLSSLSSPHWSHWAEPYGAFGHPLTNSWLSNKESVSHMVYISLILDWILDWIWQFLTWFTDVYWFCHECDFIHDNTYEPQNKGHKQVLQPYSGGTPPVLYLKIYYYFFFRLGKVVKCAGQRLLVYCQDVRIGSSLYLYRGNLLTTPR